MSTAPRSATVKVMGIVRADIGFREKGTGGMTPIDRALGQGELLNGLRSSDEVVRDRAWAALHEWRDSSVGVCAVFDVPGLMELEIVREFTIASTASYLGTVTSFILNGIQLFFRVRGDGHQFLDPMPGRRLLGSIYADGYEKNGRQDGLLGYPDYFAEEENRVQSARELLAFLNAQLPSLGVCRTVLEIGAGAGYLLKLGRQSNGWLVEAVELAPAFVGALEAKGIPVHVGWFEDLDFGNSLYHLVVMTDVLEHVRDPEVVVRKARERLHSGGFLVIGVPAADRNGPMFGFLQHLHHFSPESLQNLLIAQGFRPVHVRGHLKTVGDDRLPYRHLLVLAQVAENVQA